MQRCGTQNVVTEWGFTAQAAWDDPFNQIELDVVFTNTAGREWRVPAFWAGGAEWRVRFAPPQAGPYRYETVCSDAADAGLHGVAGELAAAPYTGQNPLLQRGGLRVSQNRRFLEHADGTPFFWLGDTWWMGLCRRLSFDDFRLLSADRVAKGFTLIQIIAGLYPDMPAFDERGVNEAGFPWEPDYARINPAYFDAADLRIAWLVRSGLVPCIVGCWGYFLPWMGSEGMKRHWRNLVARWGAYPAIWCLAGEAAMPYYLSEDKKAEAEFQKKGWAELGRYLQDVDPFDRPVTIHPTEIGRDQVNDDSVLDFNMLQTGHGGYDSVPNTVDKTVQECGREPAMPVVISETNYEGILHGSQDETQRWQFWVAILSGATGFTYGANGIWQLNTRERPYGPSPWGGSWGNTPWEDAYRLAGSAQVGWAAGFLQRYPWWRFEPRPDWVAPHGNAENPQAPFAAGIPGELRIIYMYAPLWPWTDPSTKVTGIEPGVSYRATFVNPRNGVAHAIGEVKADAEGGWAIPLTPEQADWLLVLEAARP